MWCVRVHICGHWNKGLVSRNNTNLVEDLVLLAGKV